MFDEKTIKAYRSISAPDELHEKIMVISVDKRRFSLPPTVKIISTLAACFVLIFAAFHFTKSSPMEISINGQELNESVVFTAVSNGPVMRSMPVNNISVSLDVKKETKVMVSDGHIVLNNGETVTEYTLTQPENFDWAVIEGQSLDDCKMTITDKDDTTVITLSYDENNNIVATKDIK